jgi:transcriptional regulator with GAF, ATPase, and Fis domain
MISVLSKIVLALFQMAKWILLGLLSSYATVSENSATLSSELINSELFGHNKGAFTSAHQTTIGKFEQASKGILFLDELEKCQKMHNLLSCELLKIISYIV